MRVLLTFVVETDSAVEDLSTVADIAENFEGIMSRADGCITGARLVRVERVGDPGAGAH